MATLLISSLFSSNYILDFTQMRGWEWRRRFEWTLHRCEDGNGEEGLNGLYTDARMGMENKLLYTGNEDGSAACNGE
jgi:hypothetical protein